MAHPSITVEQFFKEHGEALQDALIAGEENLKRINPRTHGKPARPGP